MERLIKIGKVNKKNAKDITRSRLGIGLEKLDRNAFDPNKVYDKLGDLGVKWVRIQSGWAKTEQKMGTYDFKWLDLIVDNLLSNGLKPWMCICYGNGLYDELAQETFGAVGYPPIFSEEANSAWKKYVKALIIHFRGRVQYYEIWNEPDGRGSWCWKRGVNAKEYANFAIETAKIIKQADDKAMVVGGSLCEFDTHYIHELFENGMIEYIDAISFHQYSADERKIFERVSSIKAMCELYNKDLQIIQGESGSQSRSGGKGALKDGAWTQRKQAKQLARQTMSNLLTEVFFTSYFSTIDMIEALHGKVGLKESYLDYGYFGVLSADFDENGFSIGEYSPKMSYYTLQTIAAIFSENIKNTPLPILVIKEKSSTIFGEDVSYQSLISGGFKKDNGAFGFVYWHYSDLMTTDFASTISLNIAGLSGKIRLIDLLTGDVYEIPDSILIKKGENRYILNNLPITDYPLLLTFGDFYE